MWVVLPHWFSTKSHHLPSSYFYFGKLLTPKHHSMHYTFQFKLIFSLFFSSKFSQVCHNCSCNFYWEESGLGDTGIQFVIKCRKVLMDRIHKGKNNISCSSFLSFIFYRITKRGDWKKITIEKKWSFFPIFLCKEVQCWTS